MIQASLAGLPAFVMYLLAGGLLTVLFGAVYIRLTPHDELALVRSGNLAAAIALGGNLLGFSIPLDRAIQQASSLGDCTIWALVAAIVQWGVYLLVRFLMKDLAGAIAGNNVAVATLLAAVAIVAGLLNAASMTL